MWELLLAPGEWWNYFLTLDEQLFSLVAQYGSLTLLFIFVVVFLESGVVLTPFFPGDSLLFAAGAVAATGALPITGVYFFPLLAGILGGMFNYRVGRWVGKVAFKRGQFWFKKKYVTQAHGFYEKHGQLAVILARFMPIIRTYVPFVAGIAKMNTVSFLVYNFVGAAVWVAMFVFGGYFFGNLPWVRDNFHVVIAAIVLISLVPALFEFVRLRFTRS